jgi:3-oxoacyl-[acyl-carrier-protein] synthase III
VAASEDCLEGSAYDRSEIDLLIYTGVYRDEFLSEPALAALVAGEVGMNDSLESTTGQRTFAFDVINGALGFLNAVFVASQMIQSRRFGRAMIVAAEVENNSEVRPELRRGIKEAGSAIILDSSPDGSGFESFFFTQQTEYLDELQTLSTHDNRGTFLSIKQDLLLEDHYLDCVNEAIGSYLMAEGLSLTDINVIIPPQISASFITRLSAALGEARRKFIDVTDLEGDLFSSSVPYALQAACQSGHVRPGDLALIVGVGSGIQVGCALYRF